MKKITLLVAALFVGTMAFSQTVLIDHPQNQSGLLSTFWDNDEAGVYCADYFMLDNAVSIESISFPGFTVNGGDQVNPAGLYLDFSLYIFTSVGDQPFGNPEVLGDAVVALENISLTDAVIDDGGSIGTTFHVDVAAANGGAPIILQPGEYWISAVPTMEGSDPLWYWLGSDMVIGADGMIIDPADLFGDGLLDWTPIPLVTGDPFPSFAWTAYGEDLLSVNDNLLKSISTYPNPTTGILNLQTPSNVDVNSVSLFDVLGKKVSADYTNGTINMTSLSQGIYLLKVETSAGTLTQKVVKQ